MKKKYVYFIRESLGSLAPVKIGVAESVESRRKDLQCANSRKLVVAATIGPFSPRRALEVERALHHKFKKHCLRGEWFTGVVLWKLGDIREQVAEIDLPNEAMYSEDTYRMIKFAKKLAN